MFTAGIFVLYSNIVYMLVNSIVGKHQRIILKSGKKRLPRPQTFVTPGYYEGMLKGVVLNHCSLCHYTLTAKAQCMFSNDPFEQDIF